MGSKYFSSALNFGPVDWPFLKSVDVINTIMRLLRFILVVVYSLPGGLLNKRHRAHFGLLLLFKQQPCAAIYR